MWGEASGNKGYTQVFNYTVYFSNGKNAGLLKYMIPFRERKQIECIV